MSNISIYTLTSVLHDAQAVTAATQEFLDGLDIQYDFKDDNFSDYGTAPLSLIYVRTGGTEGIFRRLLPELKTRQQSAYGQRHKFFLLTSGKSNSLAASLEILSFLRQQGLQGEVIHGDAQHISHRIQLLEQVALAMQTIKP